MTGRRGGGDEDGGKNGDGNVVVITGANEGIGHHVLRTLLADGYRVAGLDVNGENLRPLQEAYPERARYYECDVSETADVEQAVSDVIDRWGRIDTLVNNAAVFHFGLFGERTLADARREFEVNYFGYVRTIRAVLPHMRARNRGIIHNVGSGVGPVGHPGLSGYAATKAAIESLTRSLRMELRDENVRCTVMYPALAKTRSAAELGYPESAFDDPADVGRRLARKIESTGPVVYSDWKTRLGLALTKRFPFIIRRGTEWALDWEGETDNRAE